MHPEYVERTERVGDLIVQIMQDGWGGEYSPRTEHENVTLVYGDHNHYTIGDGEPPSEHMHILERGGLRLLYRYMRLFGDPANEYDKLIGFAKLNMLDHSGITFWLGELGSSSHHWSDPGGWDSGAVGYVYITRKRWDQMAGGDPFAIVDGTHDFPLGSVPVKEQQWYHLMKAEVGEYDDWAKGNVWCYTITKPCEHGHEDEDDETIARCPHSEVVDSCGGFIGDPGENAWPEAKAEAEALAGAVRHVR